jgi:uncharacterized SAM-binding protein YcdF (DUF218 family)
VVTGIALVFLVQLAVDNTTVADRIVTPLFRPDTPATADVMVVLGAGIVGPCQPNLTAVWRTILASRLWREGRAPILVFTGGAPPGMTCPVSQVMADFAVGLGVPQDRIRVESVSSNTYENGRFTAPILTALNARRILLVTDRLHMARSTAVFATLGFHIERASVPIWLGHRDNVEMFHSGVREYLALAYYTLRGWVDFQQITRR